MWDYLYGIWKTFWNICAAEIPDNSISQCHSDPEIRSMDQIPEEALLVVGLVELALLHDLDPDSSKALEAIVGASVFARAYTDYAFKDDSNRERYYSAMTFNEIIGMCEWPTPEYLNLQMFNWLCLLGQIALTDKKMGFDGKVLDFNYHDSRFLRWISIKDKQQEYVLNVHDVCQRLIETQGFEKVSGKWMKSDNAEPIKESTPAQVASCKSSLFNHEVSRMDPSGSVSVCNARNAQSHRPM